MSDTNTNSMHSRSIVGSDGRRAAQSGFGLVEILIALVLGLILSIGMANVFLSSKQAYRTQDALSGIQQNGRYAMEVLTRSIRMAGNQGCSNLSVVSPNVIANDVPGSKTFDNSEAVRGYKVDGNFADNYPGAKEPGQAAPGKIVANTNMITVSGAMSCGAFLKEAMADAGSDIEIDLGTGCDLNDNNDSGKGYLLLITDCKTSDLFRSSGVATDTGDDKVVIKHGAAKNSTSQLSKAYGVGAQVFKFIQSDFYVGTNASGGQSLYLRENSDDAGRQELVEGVENLELWYGEDNNSDLAVDDYFDQDGVTDWADVYSVRVRLTLRSLGTNIALEDNDPVNPNPDLRLFQAMTATVGLRNKLP